MLRLRAIAKKSLPLLLLLIVVTAPTQWSLPLPGRFHLTVADLLLCLAVPVGLLAGVRFWRLPPLYLLFLGLVFCSTLAAGLNATTLKELFQLTLYFGCGTALVLAVLSKSGERYLQLGVRVSLFAGSLVLLLAAQQYHCDAADPLVVRGSFGNHNVLGGYLALLLPLAFGVFTTARSIAGKIALPALIVAGLSLMLAGPAWLAVALALLALAAWRSRAIATEELEQATPRSRRYALLRRRLWLPATGVALMLLFTHLLANMPRGNSWQLLNSLALYDEAGTPTRRYPEWQAATLMALERPWVGLGPGAYQERIGEFYGVVPRATGPSEPDIQNLYLVLAATMGLPAAFTFLLLLGSAVARGVHRTAAASANMPLGGIWAGLTAAVAAFAFVALWHPLMVRGVGLLLALLLAALYHQPDTISVRSETAT